MGSLALIAPRVPLLAQLALLTAAVAAMALADATVFRHRHRQLHAAIRPVVKQPGVTPKELFFDLIFVYAFLQVAALRAEDPTREGVARGAPGARRALVRLVRVHLAGRGGPLGESRWYAW